MRYFLRSVIEQYQAGKRCEYVFFWGHHVQEGRVTKACFSQWYPARFHVDGVEYNCAEQYMMAEKARLFADEDVRMQIMQCEDPSEIKALGQLVRPFDAGIWSKHAQQIVIRGNLHKFGQHPELCRFLLDTGECILVEASPYDNIWGIGMKESDEGVDNPCLWKGTNYLGFALMEVRDLLKETHGETNPAAISSIPCICGHSGDGKCHCTEDDSYLFPFGCCQTDERDAE